MATTGAQRVLAERFRELALAIEGGKYGHGDDVDATSLQMDADDIVREECPAF